MRTLLFIIAVAFSAAPSWADDRYFADVIDLPGVYDVYAELIRPVAEDNSWLVDGTQIIGPPVSDFSMNGASRTLAVGCLRDQCGANMIFLIFDPTKTQLWGLLRIDGKPIFLGDPDEATRATLSAASDANGVDLRE